MFRRRVLLGFFLFACASRGQSFSVSKLTTDRTNSVVRVRVDDPVYLKKKDYEGYPLKAVIEKYFSAASRQDPAAELIFHTRDGYDPSMTLTDALSGGGVIAMRDLGAQAPQKWISFDSHGRLSTPADFYLVWSGEGHSLQRFPWPYQIESIELVKASVFRNAQPTSSSGAVQKGFETFRHTCMTCHSVNLVGGTMGGELNVPLNVTEYWKPNELVTFVTSPKSVRATSKMPKLGISIEDASAVAQYLKAMAKQKVCHGEADCAASSANLLF